MKKKNLIFILNQMSNLIGMGHYVRSAALAAKLQENGLEVNLILESNYSNNAKENIYKSIYHIGENDIQSFEAILKSEIKNNIIVIVDVLNQAFKYVEICCKLKVKCLALDYFNHQNQYPSVIINLINHNINEEDNLRKNSLYFEGRKFSIIRTEIFKYQTKFKNKTIHNSIRNILITFGGSDPSNNSLLAVERLERCQNRLNINILIGPLFSKFHLKKLLAYNSKHKIFFYSNMDSLLDLYYSCDLIYCGGGGTLLEALFLGIPTIVCPQNYREYNHAMMYKKLNACKIMNFDIEKLDNIILRKRLSNNARNAIDGYGSKRISEILLHNFVLSTPSK